MSSTGCDLRVVVDAQIALAMFLVPRDQPDAVSPKRALLKLLLSPSFSWLWTPDIIEDYERGALAIESDRRIVRRAFFDRIGFNSLMAALQLSQPVKLSAATIRAARRRLEQAPKSRDRDLDDAVYLACAVDGRARMLVSKDSDLRSIGNRYEAVRVVGWVEFEEELRASGLLP
jgi:predicted nucleic acid-binding protein